MFKPISFLSLVASFAAFLAAIVTIATVWEPFKPLANEVLRHKISFNSFFLMVCAWSVFLAPFFIMNSKLYKARAKLNNTELELSSLKGILENSERLRMTDVVTGIPNQAQFDFDLGKIGKDVSYDRPHQLIFLDLVGFGKINNKFGYAKGDEIIEYFARSLHDTMRRNEFIYKLPYNEAPQPEEMWRRAYRKHTGGDEFLIVIGGQEADALGFLVRLENRVVREINRHVQRVILTDNAWNLSFSASIVPIYPNDTRDELMERAHEGMRVARQPGSKKRVFWTTKLLPDNMEDDWKKTIYEKAVDVFSI